jgi:hypothetical protein
MIDLYCERLGPGLWAEPVNALSNLIFIVAAVASWRLSRAYGLNRWEPRLLVGLMAVVGIGSFLFHTFATPWARALDVIPILLFQMLLIWTYFRHVTRANVFASGAAVTALVAASLAARTIPNGVEWSLNYLPALLSLASLGAFHAITGRRARWALLAAASAFIVSLLFRTLDGAMCHLVPAGTHFLWHLFNGAAVFLSFWSLAANLMPKEPDAVRGLHEVTLSADL